MLPQTCAFGHATMRTVISTSNFEQPDGSLAATPQTTAAGLVLSSLITGPLLHRVGGFMTLTAVRGDAGTARTARPFLLIGGRSRPRLF